MYTDGLSEATRKDGEQFEEDRIQAALAEIIQPGAPATAVARIEHIANVVKDFTQGAPQSDDLTLLTLLYK